MGHRRIVVKIGDAVPLIYWFRFSLPLFTQTMENPWYCFQKCLLTSSILQVCVQIVYTCINAVLFTKEYLSELVNNCN